MTVELGQLPEGKLILVSNEAFPAEVLRVEYYAAQQLFVLVYDTPDQENELMPYEVNAQIAAIVTPGPDVMAIISARQGQDPYGYDVPLVKVMN